MSDEQHDRVRLDKWLWAARFFKTRGLAAEAIDGGKVDVNGARVKRAKMVQVGDEVRIRQTPFEHAVMVRGVSERRGPASVAATLYEETAASKKKRDALATQIRSMPAEEWDTGRPTKRDRREIEKFRRRSGDRRHRGVVQAVAAVEAEESRRDSGLGQARELNVGRGPRRELVPRTDDQYHWRPGEPVRERFQSNVRWERAGPENDLVGARATIRQPANRRRDALRETEHAQPNDVRR